jgi:hypothetical protein
VKHFKIPPESVWECTAEVIAHPLAPQIDSLILSVFPAIFSEFNGKRFSLLWRGSRDCFHALTFHRRCDGHANTLTVILNTNRNIFGEFTPVEWESQEWNWKTGKHGKADNRGKANGSQKSFLFTVTNSHNITPRIFWLKAAKKHRAIHCRSAWSSDFWDF